MIRAITNDSHRRPEPGDAFFRIAIGHHLPEAITGVGEPPGQLGGSHGAPSTDVLVHVDVGAHLGHPGYSGEERVRIGGSFDGLLVEEGEVRQLVSHQPRLGRSRLFERSIVDVGDHSQEVCTFRF